MALAAAVAFTGRKKILVMGNGYHGGTLYFKEPLPELSVNLPHDFVLAPYNDIPGTQSVVDSLPKDSLAAILVEPLQGSGGCIPGDKPYLQYLNTTAHKLGALFIVDEVMTSRLSYHGLSSSLGLTPDLVTLGKWIGGGMTFGAFGGRKDGGVMGMFDPRTGELSHSGTFNNNIVTMAAGVVGMDIFTENELLRLNKLGKTLKEGIEKVLLKYEINPPQPKKRCPEKNEDESPFTGINSEHPSNPVSVESLSLAEKEGRMWVTGLGSMLCIHFSGENANSLHALFWHHMLEGGMYLAQRGFIALTLELGEEHIEKFVKGVDEFAGKYKLVLSS
jgi:glutamate-1-semialdehyde 2,1-aminomutase